MSKADLAVVNGRVVTSSGVFPGGVAIRDGRIISVGDDDSLPPAVETYDCGGKHILPGLVDPHVHLGGGLPYDQILQSETASAAAGGVTTVIQYRRAPNGSFLDTFPRDIEMCEANMRIDTWFHFILDSMEQVNEIPRYADEFGVTSYKFYMGGYEPGNPIGLVTVNDAILFRAMELVRELGPHGYCMVHCEDDSLVSFLTDRMRSTGREDLAAYSESRPDFVEEQDIIRAIWLATKQRCQLYIPHTTVGMAVAAAGAARLDGVRIVLETCPHYLALTPHDERLLAQGPGVGKVAPALRDEEHQDKLWDGLHRGYIHTIGSDHVPIVKTGAGLWDEKPGFPGLATALPVVITEGVMKNRLSLSRLAEVMALNPARIFGLHPQKGELAVGTDGDLVVVDLERQRRVSPEMTMSEYTSPFEGKELVGWPDLTVRRGEVIFRDGQVLAEPGSGRVVPRRADATVLPL
ncbi:dihydroorotase [Desertimonas flava]|uniref:dihydroorotase n=1 Tax=Desertimonas flava TaxID=2064846 RepID=UPI0013C3E4EA|nr:amidohydrolase family protein [Desertimonas flava]